MQEAIEVNPRDAALLGLGLCEDGHFAQAEPYLRAACEFVPTAQSLHWLGVCLLEQDRAPESTPYFERAMAMLRDEMFSLTSNYAKALGEVGRSQEALALLTRLNAQAPDNQLALYNLGLVLLQMKRHQESIAVMDRVLALTPNDDKAKFCAGFANLALGNYIRGFADYECRLKDDYNVQPAPEWIDEPLEGKTILVRGEQGLGDNIMFGRYLRYLRAAGAKEILFWTPAPTRSLFENRAGVRLLGDIVADWPEFDYWTWSMSLAHKFGTDTDSVPEPLGIYYDANLLSVWNYRMGNASKLRVGLCWSGGRKSKYDSFRSLPASVIKPLLDIPGVTFFNFQQDVRETDTHDYEDMRRKGLVDITEHLTDFRQTAHAMRNLDLMITCDTSVAHMAGTVGIPTWVMITSHRTYWLWIQKTDRSPWYPSIRVFEQKGGDWPEVISRVQFALAREVNAKAA